MPKVFNFFPAIRTRNDRADDQEQNIAEFVFNFSRLAIGIYTSFFILKKLVNILFALIKAYFLLCRIVK
jgi:hypothetical protein